MSQNNDGYRLMTAVRFQPPYEEFLKTVGKTDECDPEKVRVAIEMDLPRLSILPTPEGDAEALKARFNKSGEIKSYSQGGMDAGGCSNYYRATLSDEIKLALAEAREFNFAYVDSNQALRGFSLIYLKARPDVWMITTTAHFDKDGKERIVDIFSSKHFFSDMKSEYQSEMTSDRAQAILFASLNSREVISQLGGALFTTNGEVNPICIEKLMLSTTLGPYRIDMLGNNLGQVFYGNVEEQKEALDAFTITKISDERISFLQTHVITLALKLIVLIEVEGLLEREKSKCKFLLAKMQDPVVLELVGFIENNKRQGLGLFDSIKSVSQANKIEAARTLLNFLSVSATEQATITVSEIDLKALVELGSPLARITAKAFIFLPRALKQKLYSAVPPGKALGI
jgi:hypothetical protein